MEYGWNNYEALGDRQVIKKITHFLEYNCSGLPVIWKFNKKSRTKSEIINQ